MNHPNKLKSYALVGVQFGCLGLLALLGAKSIQPYSLAIIAVGVFLGLWAIISMKLSVNILPDVRDSQELIISGPYKLIRHPMYTALLLVGLGLLLSEPSPLSLALWIVLGADLIVKLRYEEKLLRKKFPAYSSYSDKTYHIIPYIF